MAFFIPSQLIQTQNCLKMTEKQLAFYWINNDQNLIISTRSNKTCFSSHGNWLIWINGGVGLRIDQENLAFAYLDQEVWQECQMGEDGYPRRDGMFMCIAGGEDKYFHIEKFEFFGINI